MIKKFFKNDVSSLLSLALPMVCMGVLQSGVFFFDTIFIAHLGSKILAAAALVNWLFATFIVVFLGCLSAINIVISHKFGEENHADIGKVFRESWWVSILLAPCAFLFFWFIAPVFSWFGQPIETVQIAESYLHALAFGTLVWFPMMVCSELLMGMGDMKTMMIGNVSMVVLNILFNYLFIFGKLGLPALGIVGSGVGLTISYALTLLGLLVFLKTNTKYKQYFKGLFRFEKPKFVGELLKTGAPMGAMYSFELAFFLALTLFMGAYKHALLVPNQITLQYGGICMTIAFAIAQALTIRMGHLLGAKEHAEAIRANNAATFLTLVVMIISAVIFIFFSSALVSLDFDIHDPQNDSIVYYAREFFFINAIYQIFEGLRITFFGALRSLQDTRFTLIASLIGFWAIPFPLGYVLVYHTALGGAGIWWGMTIGAIVNMGLLYGRFKYKVKNITSY